MKTKIKSYWALVVLVVMANVIVFSFFSRKLETFVIDYTVGIQANSGL
jgi:hypothetical protein